MFLKNVRPVGAPCLTEADDQMHVRDFTRRGVVANPFIGGLGVRRATVNRVGNLLR
jgi:hypothetical protein